MRTIKRTDKGTRIIDQTPSCRNFEPKALQRYRELVEHVKSCPVLTSIYEMNLARQKERKDAIRRKKLAKNAGK